ncbi:MAG: M1 family metallopeptidase [Bacteroidia bacterium]
MKNKIFVICICAIAFASCNTSKKSTATVTTTASKEEEIKTEPPKPYRASNTVTNEIKDTKLEVSFDWSKKWMYGKATLTVKPHFYSTSHLDLNARGMELKEVSLITASGKQRLNYKYENDSIKIDLDRPYTRDETYKIYIDYIAMPDELKSVGGSTAINSDKGLYFINADGKVAGKPQQIWTQGETQSNQVWMPTIDSPNQRFTQEITMTVDSAFVTLSNGLMVSTKDNGNGTRTDVWRQTLPAAPYLSMMAIGKYAIVKDKWRDKEVNYYVYPEYADDAKAIFGNTPEMIEFFSKKFVDYAWEKYSQVIAEDYVSGAMENTTATLHGTFVQQHKREMIDGTQEDVISHELFHQWFGDLVTCESWSNIPLNESFATYGEYLWQEYKYGRDGADRVGQEDLNNYMSQARQSDENLIRFNYENREDVFDGISYQKGGRILHMLRKYVGDDAFFASLRDYLNTNKFTAVESHNLRLAFEKITGEDLNWYWNQWFYNKGYPTLEINYSYDDVAKKQLVIIQQKQSLETAPLFKLPVDIDFYTNEKAIRKRITITQAMDTFAFDMPTKPELVNFDAEKMLLCKKTDNHSRAEWTYMLQHCPLYLDRYEALSKIGNAKTGTAEADATKKCVTDDKFFVIRNKAINNLKELAKSDADKANVKQLLLTAVNDPKSAVRSNAIEKLSDWYKDDDNLKEVYRSAIAKDSSYDVIQAAVDAITEKSPEEGLAVAKSLEKQNDKNLNSIIANIYAEHGDDTNSDFMINNLRNAKGFSAFSALGSMNKYLKRCKPETTDKALPAYENIARNGSQWFIKLQATNQLTALAKDDESKITDLRKQIDEAQKAGKSSAELLQDQNTLKILSAQKERIEKLVEDIKKNETDDRLKKMYSGDSKIDFSGGE